jgi:predicted GNAT family N-acyltransferase
MNIRPDNSLYVIDESFIKLTCNVTSLSYLTPSLGLLIERMTFKGQGDSMSKYQYEQLVFPGQVLSDQEQQALVTELRDVAASCFQKTPNYQALSGEKSELDKAVICLARDENGKLMGFCSALFLPVKGRGNVLHLGLTCVHPDSRGQNLTHHLTSKLLLNFIIKKSLFKETWISNCACVLSSLGNVAMYFENLYPSPYGVKIPSIHHLDIARAIDKNHRESIAIKDTAKFNPTRFVFEGSVGGTVFEKDADDGRFHHRDQALTEYYQDLLRFDRGDEALQIGKVSILTFPKYLMRKAAVKMKGMLPKPRKTPTYAN